MSNAENRGWLKENYRVFYATEKRDMDFQAHFHEFHKIIFCLNGRVTYATEGTTYCLESGDLLIIPAHCIHRSSIHGDAYYERWILWINDEYVDIFKEKILNDLFSNPLLLHTDNLKRMKSSELLKNVDRYEKETFPGHQLLAGTYLVQFLLNVTQMADRGETAESEAVRSDRRMNEVIEYINANLTEKITVEGVAGRFYLSQSRLNQLFKENNGCSIHQYIIQKRMIRAADELRSGVPVMQAARDSGCEDYSAFLRAFKKAYGCTPGELKKTK